jgi:hypothetical protein
MALSFGTGNLEAEPSVHSPCGGEADVREHVALAITKRPRTTPQTRFCEPDTISVTLARMASEEDV